ncbi:uncharacterized protein LOC109606754 [Aethina tumida]|uniref:uncharacterized protein LOC109606754 n=1 Tax=Aethina tumida TaxID=116153 RepID=UPI002147CFF3|nr:uncharacterized protein LOC109606754 [Aethina tumida]
MDGFLNTVTSFLLDWELSKADLLSVLVFAGLMAAFYISQRRPVIVPPPTEAPEDEAEEEADEEGDGDKDATEGPQPDNVVYNSDTFRESDVSDEDELRRLIAVTEEAARLREERMRILTEERFKPVETLDDYDESKILDLDYAPEEAGVEFSFPPIPIPVEDADLAGGDNVRGSSSVIDIDFLDMTFNNVNVNEEREEKPQQES